MNDLDDALRAMLRDRAGDIRALPTELADPGALDHLTPDDRPTHHRATRWMLVAAAAVVLAVTGSIIAVHNLGSGKVTSPAATVSHTPGPVRPAPNGAGRILQWTVGIDVPAGYQLMDRALAPTSQTVSLRKLADPDAKGCCGGSLPRTVYATVYNRGAFRSAVAAQAGTPVRVGDRPAWSATLPGGPFDSFTPISNDPLPSVAWEYAPDSWAVVQATTPATRELSRLLLVANAVRPGETSALRLPLRLGYLPAGLTARSASQNLVEVYGTTVTLADAADPERATSLNIQVWADNTPKEQADGAQPITVGGRPGTLYPDGAAQIVLGTRSIVIGLGGPRGSHEELMRVLAGVRWAPDVTDPSTWFDATTLVN